MFRKIAKDLNKIYHLFAKIPRIITILENPSKDVLSDSKENVSYASTLVNLDALSQLYQKTLPRGFFFEFGKFSRNRDKDQLKLNSSEHIK